MNYLHRQSYNERRFNASEKVEKNIDTGFHWYDKTNIESEDIAPLLYK